MAEVEDTQENFELCRDKFCGQCPTYPCGEDGQEALYCARGPSEKKVNRIECMCPDCSIWVDYGLGKQYYCD